MLHYSGRSGSIFVGLLIIIVGVVLLLHTTQGFDIGDLFADYWPILIIVFGIYLIITSRGHHKIPFDFDWHTGDRSFVTDKENVIQSNTFGDIKVTIDTKDFQGGQIRTVFGDVKVDLTNLDISSGERKLYLHTVFGDIKVSAPKDIALKIYASNTAGDIKIFDDKRSGFGQTYTFKSPNYENADKKLLITISHTFGDTKVW